MKNNNNLSFDEHRVIHELKHYLPAQAPLKDFVYYNTLEGFQNQKFHSALQNASEIFGYQVYLPLDDYRKLYYDDKINKEVLNSKIIAKKGESELDLWRKKLIKNQYDTTFSQKIGVLRTLWITEYKVNLDKYVFPILFRLIGAYLDQGISLDKFPSNQNGFLSSVVSVDKISFSKIFKSKRVQKLLINEELSLTDLLKIVVGNEKYFEQYLFDQQFTHPGWSGMVAVLENNPTSLIDSKKISLKEFIILELLLEIDALDQKFGEIWKPLAQNIIVEIPPLFNKPQYNELYEVYNIWQEAYEWTYYDQVLKGLQIKKPINTIQSKSFQAVFCIDDRECSFRRYLEKNDVNCETFSTAGFFNVAFYFQPEHGKFYTKLCPAPHFPQHLIKESEAGVRHKKDVHFNKNTHGFEGWILSPILGFWSMLKLAKSILYPSLTDALISSFAHMDKNGKLSIESKNNNKRINNLQLGFTVEEMTVKVEGFLNEIGLIKNFAPIVYIIGHGASSVNNTYYAGYDCGACNGRAGSVNARVVAFMANHKIVREELIKRNILIPDETQFIGGLHDTTRDEIEFYDDKNLNEINKIQHLNNRLIFETSLHENAKERSRKFLLMDTKGEANILHEKVKLRSLSLFEPRSEWDHATNALCIIGKRENNKQLFFDRRAFLNSYDYKIDSDGKILLEILNAVTPVCGGINLEYYFSKVDNYRLGSGTKLPHNVMGLIGVANGMDGDLRTGLPRQAVDIHEPLRLLVTIEHYPEVVLKTIKKCPATFEMFENEWINLAVVHPESKLILVYKNGTFLPYIPINKSIQIIENLEKLFEHESENLPVYLIS